MGTFVPGRRFNIRSRMRPELHSSCSVKIDLWHSTGLWHHLLYTPSFLEAETKRLMASLLATYYCTKLKILCYCTKLDVWWWGTKNYFSCGPKLWQLHWQRCCSSVRCVLPVNRNQFLGRIVLSCVRVHNSNVRKFMNQIKVRKGTKN